MIANLHIKNIGIIDDLEIELNKGLNVLTGETGAGKTLIIDSLGIICGGRFSKEMIRKGEEFSYVGLCMFEPNDPNSTDGNIIVSREIYSNGRNTCKVNGRLVTVTELKNFMESYIEIHGQNDNQKILDSRTHIRYLDNFIGNDLQTTLVEYKENFVQYNKIINSLKANYGDEKEKQRKLDLLKYQLNEIGSAQLKSDEEQKLEEKRKIMLNSEKLSTNLTQAQSSIADNAVDSISTAIKSLERIEDIDNKYLDLNCNLKSIYYDLQEISRDLNSFADDTYFDESERNEIENRLDLIFSLKRKYGNNIDEIIKYSEEIKEEIKRIENIDEINCKLKKEKLELENKMNMQAIKINEIRSIFADKLSQKINQELVDLEMKNAKINIKVTFNENGFFENGKDNVQIFIKTNIGESEHELSKIASGGEMSRAMLAIKKVLADTDKTPVLIFDEIDTGISGKASNAVADKLKKISNSHQVLCISHSASIAAIADYNYHIRKIVKNDRTNTKINLLNEEELIKEIACISSGEVNEITIRYAQELRNKRAS